MNEPIKNVENLTAKLKSIEPKFFLLSKTVWGMIILAILVAAKWAGFNIDESAGNAADVFEKIGAILVVLGLRTKSQPLTFKTKLPSGAANIFLCMIGASVGLAFIGLGLTSCTPTAYQVNTAPYALQIETNPEAVIVQPEDVIEVGGFQAEFGAKLLTDQGEIDISDRGVSGDVVVDLRSGK